MHQRRKCAQSERVNWLIQNYKQLFDQGYSVREIADIAKVHYSTVYNTLEQIADFNNCSREDLLRQVHPKHSITKHSVKTKTQIQISVVQKDISEILHLCNEIDKTIDDIMRKENVHE